VLADQHRTAPCDLRELEPSCPEDLAELCAELLRLDPSQRLQGPEVRRRLGAGARDDTAAARVPIASPHRVFIGREAELRELRRAFDDVHHGAAITVFVHGESGIGKSMLIQQFVDAIEAEADSAVVLVGQCREHEAVPFKVMDGIIDALSSYACRLSEVAAAELVPQNAALLPGVFPVLGRIPAVAKAPRPLHAASDPFQQRKRVFTALREMLFRLTERSRLISVVDDMQWADSDSLHLLEEILRPPDPPRVLFLASVRSADDAPALPPLPGEVRRVRLRPLDPEESARLAGVLLERFAPEQQAPTARIVEETGGHPLFIGELVRHAAVARRAALKPLRLDEAIWTRISQLDPTAASVLEILSIAIAPLSEEILRTATALDASGFQRGVALLRTSHLVRSASPTHAMLEVYHDRVRESVVHHLGEGERVALNARIAAALEASGAHVQPELLIYHLQGAGHLEQAARKALEAADRAQASLAFEQASQLYETALGSRGGPRPSTGRSSSSSEAPWLPAGAAWPPPARTRRPPRARIRRRSSPAASRWPTSSCRAAIWKRRRVAVLAISRARPRGAWLAAPDRAPDRVVSSAAGVARAPLDRSPAERDPGAGSGAPSAVQGRQPGPRPDRPAPRGVLRDSLATPRDGPRRSRRRHVLALP
jgi:hypothetical protein